MADEQRCLNCGHRMGLHWTTDLRCRRADDCLCQRWMSQWLAPPPARRLSREPGPDAYSELIDSVTATFVAVDTSPPKPPYGTPERAAWAAAHG